MSSDPASYKTWSSEKLKTFLRDQGVSTNGRKKDFLDTAIRIHSQSVAEVSIDRQSLNIPKSTPFGTFDGLPKEGWGREGFPEIDMHLVRDYLTKLVSYIFDSKFFYDMTSFSTPLRILPLVSD